MKVWTYLFIVHLVSFSIYPFDQKKTNYQHLVTCFPTPFYLMSASILYYSPISLLFRPLFLHHLSSSHLFSYLLLSSCHFPIPHCPPIIPKLLQLRWDQCLLDNNQICMQPYSDFYYFQYLGFKYISNKRHSKNN